MLALVAAWWPLSGLALDPGKALTQYGHDHWTAEDGLPVTSVEVLMQTPDGYLWVGDEQGLARFDGASFTLFNRRTTPGLSQHDVRSLAWRRAGGLWVGTWRGLFILEGGRARPVTVIPEDPFVVIEALVEDRAGTLWAGTQGYGLVRLAPGPPARYTTEDGLPNNTVWALQEDGQGALWIGTAGGLARLRDGKVESFADHPRLPRGSLISFAVAPDGSLWIGGVRGLAHYRAGDFQLYTTEHGLPHRSVDSLAFDGDGALWLGTRGGLARLHQGRISAMGKSGLADSVVKALQTDHEGSLWIGTESGGLERLRDGRFTALGRPEGLADDSIITILEDRRGALWFGTKRGLTRLADGEMTTWTETDGLVVPIITSLYEDSRGTIWIGTTNGLYHVEAGKLVPLTSGGGLVNEYVSSLFEDAAGTLWVGTSSGLARLSAAGLQFPPEEEVVPCTVVNVIEPAPDGGLWVGTNGGGLYHYKDGRATVYGPAQGLSEVDVFALYQDADGTLWVGTNDGGLNVLADGRVSVVTTRQGLHDDLIAGIVDDRLGHLWLTSSRGISRIAKAELLEVVAGRRATVTPAVFDTADGLRSPECMGGGQGPSVLRAADGRLWFSTLGGAAVVDPRRLSQRHAPPPVLIERLLVDGEPAAAFPDPDPASTLRLPPGSRRVEIGYTALTFLAPERVRFRVRLEGFDPQWVEMGNRRAASYTNLPPGSYRFRVRAANADGVWNEEGAALAFGLAPRFQQTPWFYGLAAAALTLAAWGLYRARTRALAARYQAVVEERTRIARELHDTLAQGLAGVALQLEAARATLDGAQPQARPYLARAHGQVRETLAAARRSVWNLRAAELEDHDLPEALSLLAQTLTAPNGPTIDVELSGAPRPLPDRIEENLFRIGQEAITNAVRHAHADRIRVELAFSDGLVRLSVEDDGLGLPADEAPANGSAPHFGMAVMNERAEQLAGHFAVRSRVGHGTAVTVEVPVGT